MVYRFVARLGLATVLGLSSMSAAMAYSGLTTAPTYMRTGPGPHFRIVQHVPRNAMINVGTCTRQWCRVSWRYRSGYVPVYVIERGPAEAPPPDYAPPPTVYVAPPPPVYVEPGWGWGDYDGDGWGWGWGWRWGG